MMGDVGAAMGTAPGADRRQIRLLQNSRQCGTLTGGTCVKNRDGRAYVREWASAQAAAGYINYDRASGRFSISPEQALVLRR